MRNVDNWTAPGNREIAELLNRGFVRSACEIMRELEVSPDKEEIRELAGLLDGPPDFTFEADGCEFRAIHENFIREVAQKEIEYTIRECYLGGSREIPWWIEIDWGKTVQNCIDADGYGHHFSSYDGSEIECCGYHFFRVG